MQQFVLLDDGFGARRRGQLGTSCVGFGFSGRLREGCAKSATGPRRATGTAPAGATRPKLEWRAQGVCKPASSLRHSNRTEGPSRTRSTVCVKEEKNRRERWGSSCARRVGKQSSPSALPHESPRGARGAALPGGRGRHDVRAAELRAARAARTTWPSDSSCRVAASPPRGLLLAPRYDVAPTPDPRPRGAV